MYKIIVYIDGKQENKHVFSATSHKATYALATAFVKEQGKGNSYRDLIKRKISDTLRIWEAY